jgi:hypothetical protein
VPVLFLTEHQATKTKWRTGAQLHIFLTVALDEGEWSASRPGRFSPKERAPSTHWIGSWVGPRASLDAVVKKKILSCCEDSNPPIFQLIAQCYTTELSQLHNLMFRMGVSCYKAYDDEDNPTVVK